MSIFKHDKTSFIRLRFLESMLHIIIEQQRVRVPGVRPVLQREGPQNSLLLAQHPILPSPIHPPNHQPHLLPARQLPDQLPPALGHKIQPFPHLHQSPTNPTLPPLIGI
jgi:hypothetical protein